MFNVKARQSSRLARPIYNVREKRKSPLCVLGLGTVTTSHGGATLESISTAAVRGSIHAFLVVLIACQIAYASIFHSSYLPSVPLCCLRSTCGWSCRSSDGTRTN